MCKVPLVLQLRPLPRGDEDQEQRGLPERTYELRPLPGAMRTVTGGAQGSQQIKLRPLPGAMRTGEDRAI